MSHPRPWRRIYANTASNNGNPLYLVAADGRKICTIWGKETGEREETADLILKAVRIYDRAMAKKAEREAAALVDKALDTEALDTEALDTEALD